MNGKEQLKSLPCQRFGYKNRPKQIKHASIMLYLCNIMYLVCLPPFYQRLLEHHSTTNNYSLTISSFFAQVHQSYIRYLISFSVTVICHGCQLHSYLCYIPDRAVL